MTTHKQGPNIWTASTCSPKATTTCHNSLTVLVYPIPKSENSKTGKWNAQSNSRWKIDYKSIRSTRSTNLFHEQNHAITIFNTSYKQYQQMNRFPSSLQTHTCCFKLVLALSLCNYNHNVMLLLIATPKPYSIQ